MKVLGMDQRTYLDSKFPTGEYLEGWVRCTSPSIVHICVCFFELAVLRTTFQSNSCIEINHSSCCTRTYCLAFIIPSVKKTKFTSLREKPPNGKMWSGWRLTQIQEESEVWTKIGKAFQKREKWANEKQTLDNAPRLRGIYFIDSEDGEYKETIKKRKWKVGSSKKVTKKRSPLEENEEKSCESNKIPKTKHACIVEAHESTGQRLESSPLKDHEDHIASNGCNSMTHYNVVQFSQPQAMTIRDAKAAVDKEWKKLETIPACQLEKVKSKKRSYSGSTKETNKSTSLLDICHLKVVEMELQFQKYKGRVVL